MKTIVRTLFGSHLYGTDTPESDTDFKGVHLPNPVAMLLQEPQDSISRNTKEGNAEKNTSEDVDYQSTSLHKFFKLLAKQETMTLEMLFTPANHIVEVTPEWRTVLHYRDSFITKSIESDIGYIRNQSSKYGIKGSRMATVKLALSWVESWIKLYGSITGLGQHYKAIQEFADANEHSEVVGIPHPSGITQFHWDVVGRKLPFGNSLGQTHAVLKQIFDNYGERTRRAESNEGIDWKALSHAMRVAYQNIERLNAGELTFPRPEAKLLLRIKKGEMHFKDVSERLEEAIEAMEHAQKQSSLPEAIDVDLASKIVLNFYSNQVFQTDPRLLGWEPAKHECLLGKPDFKFDDGIAA